MRRSVDALRIGSWIAGLLALTIAAAACGPAAAPAPQPAQPAAPSAKQAEPAKPAAPPAKQAEPAKAVAPAAEPPTRPAQPAKPEAAGEEADPALIEAAKKEGKVTVYTSLELTLARKLGQMFEKRYGVTAEVIRTGSEQIFAQFMKEQGSNVRKADTISTADASHFLTMRRADVIAPFRPKAADSFFPELRAKLMDPDNYWFAQRLYAHSMVYNTSKVKEADAPKNWKELVEPKWKGKIVHAHPSYSGGVVVQIHLLEPILGKDYYRQLAKNDVLVIQSSIDVVTKVLAGERDIGAGAVGYLAHTERRKGNPINIVYPTEGVPLNFTVQALAKNAPHPNAAKLFLEYHLSREAQQMLAEDGGNYPVRRDVKPPEGLVPLDKIKALIPDPAALEKAREGIQKEFKDLFGV